MSSTKIPSTKEAMKRASKLGCKVVIPRRSGECRVSHPCIERPVVFNVRRKDARRSLLVFLSKVERHQEMRA